MHGIVFTLIATKETMYEYSRFFLEDRSKLAAEDNKLSLRYLFKSASGL